MNGKWLLDFVTHPLVLLALLSGAVALIYWRGRVDADRVTFREFIDEIRDKFMPEIRKDVKEILAAMPRRVAVSNSPIELTDLGKKVAAHLEAEKWARETAPAIQSRVVGMKPFRIDEVASAHVEEVANQKAWKERIAVCAYEFGLQRDQVSMVLRISLRDELLRLTGQTMPD